MTRHKTTTLTASQTRLKLLLAELVKFPTITTEHATNKAALDWVKFQLRELPLSVYDVEHQGIPSLIMTTRPTKEPKVMLLAHIDVSPAPPEDFVVTEGEGRLYGRGVYDMKFAIAAYIQLFLEIGDELLRYDLGIMITADEEMSGKFGARKLAAAGWHPEVLFNPDAIGHGGWQLEGGAKGIAVVHARAAGVGGHSSRRWEFDNAIEKLIRFLDELGAYFPSEPCGDPQHRHNTMSVNMILGGRHMTQTPHNATASFDIRTVPGTSGAEIERLLLKTAAKYDGVTFKMDELPAPLMVDQTNAYFRLAQELIHDVAGVWPKVIFSHGATDSRHFAHLNVAHILVSPEGGNAHGDDEWLDEASFGQYYDFLRRFVERAAT